MSQMLIHLYNIIMQDNINKFHKEAFATPESFEADVDNSLDSSPYDSELKTQGMLIEKYTSGDTRYQDTIINKHPLTEIPSKISKRYSPQKAEQNTGAALSPPPAFLKSHANAERITSMRDLLNKVDEAIEIVEKTQAPIAGIDFARTHPDAAAFLERLGKSVTYEAHHSARQNIQNLESIKKEIKEEVTKIIIQSQKNVADRDFNERIVLNAIPKKTYDHLDLVAIGQEASLLNRHTNSNKPIIATRNTTNNAISSNNVFGSDQNFDFDELSNQETLLQESANRSANIIKMMEEKLVNPTSDEIHKIEDASKAIRKTIDDFVKMKQDKIKEQQVRMKDVENKIRKTLKSALPDEIDTKTDEVSLMHEIIREVVAMHPALVQKSNHNDMEFTLSARDSFLRVQIERELKEKFESKLIENNKTMEKRNRVIFEELIDRFLNP